MSDKILLSKFIQSLGKQMKRHWVVASAVAILGLALLSTPSALAERLHQTVPIPTPTQPSTPVPTATATFTAEPAVDTPAPPADTPAPPANTPAPGSTPAPATNTPALTNTTVPTAAPAVGATNTPIPTFALVLTMSAPRMALAGAQIEVRYTITNPSNQIATNVRVRNLLPEGLTLVAADALNGGRATLETDRSGRTAILFGWDSLAPNRSVEAVLTATIDADAEAGTVIDNLAVAFASNAASSTAGVSIGLPPAILPYFN
ncbi:MAG: DUF11 domain-containing protein [Caldilineaceae bacterium]|nr:DUF11 domain-containing protein [Caldilineaceae bacterium]